MSTPVFGIDLGTTNSVIAVVRDGIPQVLELDGESIVPSVVGIDPNGNLLVGPHARNQRAAYPERTIASIKRKMGTDEPTKLGERSMSPPEVSAIILKELARRGSIAAGVPVKKVVITVPAFFQDAQRAATRLAGEIAGLEVVRLVNEPTAAALAFEGGEAGRERTLLVYDLGGGTFDVSVVTTDGELTEVLASHGDVHLGGDDIDLLIAKWLAKDLGDPQALDAVAHARLLDAAERAKRQLTEDVEVRVREEFLRGGDDPLHLDVTMSRDDLEELIDPLLDRTLESVHRALSMAGRTLSEIDDIVLVGGQTRTPLVARRLTQLLGKAPRRDVHPDLCVAQGAAIAGAQSAGITTGRVLVDVTPYSFGAGCLGEVDGVMSEHRFEVVIPRGSPLPVVRSETFYTCVDNQEKLDARIFQGESVDARHNILVGRFWVEGLAPAPAGSPLVFKLALGIDGILDVEVLEKSTGMSKRTRIEAATARLSPDELAAARERTRALWAERDADDEVDTDDDSDDVAADFVSPGAPSWVGKLQKACARVTALLDRMGDEDRAETRLMLEDAKQAIAEENEEIGLELIDELTDIAHYTEEA